MKYRANSQDTWHKIKVKALDSMPIGSIMDIATNTAPTMASIVNSYSTSTQDGYSCDFINTLIARIEQLENNS